MLNKRQIKISSSPYNDEDAAESKLIDGILDSLIADPEINRPKPRLVIVINGGCVVNVYASDPQQVEIIDCDNLKGIEGVISFDTDSIIKESTTGLKEIY